MSKIGFLARSSRTTAFTLLEMMVASAILGVILLLIFSITQVAGDAWKGSAAKIESFQSARAAFESMTRTISQATLNTYYDYFTAAGNRRTASNASSFIPEKYGRYSDLHFISGKSLLDASSGGPVQITHSMFFQAPTGYADDPAYRELDQTLNAMGYYLEYGIDPARPAFLDPMIPAKNRFRLMQFSQPTQQLSVYEYTAAADARKWFTTPLSQPLADRPALQVADNIIAMVIRPKLSKEDTNSKNNTSGDLAPEFEYDSRTTESWSGGKQPRTQNQLPPVVEILLVAVDEPSFSRFGNPSAPPDLGQSQLFRVAAELDNGNDLAKLEDVLNAKQGNVSGNTKKLRYQIFHSEVPIRAAKWSQ